MEIKKGILALATLLTMTAHAIDVKFAISKSGSDYTIQIQGLNIFLYTDNNALAKIHFNNTQDTFTFASTQNNDFENKIQTYPEKAKNRYIHARDNLDYAIQRSIINFLPQNVSQNFSTNSGLTINLSYDTEFTRPFRTLYSYIREYCEIIDVQMKPLESTWWKWTRRFGKTALYSMLLAGSAYGIYKASDYLPSASTIGESIASGLQKTGSAIGSVESSVKSAVGSLKAPVLPTIEPQQGPELPQVGM